MKRATSSDRVIYPVLAWVVVTLCGLMAGCTDQAGGRKRHRPFVPPVAGAAGGEPESAELPVVATFSVVGFDPGSGDLGVAVQSKFFGVGSVGLKRPVKTTLLFES